MAIKDALLDEYQSSFPINNLSSQTNQLDIEDHTATSSMSGKEQEWRETEAGNESGEYDSDESESEPEPSQEQIVQLAIDDAKAAALGDIDPWNFTSPTDIKSAGGFTDGGDGSDDEEKPDESEVAELMHAMALTRKESLNSTSPYLALYKESGDGAMTHQGEKNFATWGWDVGPGDDFTAAASHYRKRSKCTQHAWIHGQAVPSRALLNNLYTMHSGEVKSAMSPYKFRQGNTDHLEDDFYRSLYIEIGSDHLSTQFNKDKELLSAFRTKPVSEVSLTDQDTLDKLKPLSWIDDMRDVAAQLYAAGGDEGFVVKTDA
jgi:hypothetical protein